MVVCTCLEEFLCFLKGTSLSDTTYCMCLCLLLLHVNFICSHIILRQLGGTPIYKKMKDADKMGTSKALPACLVLYLMLSIVKRPLDYFPTTMFFFL